MKTNARRQNGNPASKFEPPHDQNAALQDATRLLTTIAGLDIRDRIKGCILREALWVVYYACTGDTKNPRNHWYARYRSMGVKSSNPCDRVRREHVYRLKNAIKELTQHSCDVNRIAEKATFVCHVTKAEHDALTEVDNKSDKEGKSIDGWERYVEAGIKAYDMQQEPPKCLTSKKKPPLNKRL